MSESREHVFEAGCREKFGPIVGGFTLRSLPELIQPAYDRQAWMDLVLPVREALWTQGSEKIRTISLHDTIALQDTVPVYGLDAIGAMMLDGRDKGMVHAQRYSNLVLRFPADIGDLVLRQFEI